MALPLCPIKQEIYDNAFLPLQDAYGGKAPISACRALAGLLTDLYLSELEVRREHSSPPSKQVSNELNRFLERLRARTTIAEAATLKAFFKLSQHAQDILGAMIALEIKGLVTNFAQIDFDREDHHQALIAATIRARDWVSENQGRPTRDQLDSFFHGATELFQKIPNSNMKVGNHYSGCPQTPFEQVLHAGHRLSNISVSYHATVKAYDRFKARQ